MKQIIRLSFSNTIFCFITGCVIIISVSGCKSNTAPTESDEVIRKTVSLLLTPVNFRNDVLLTMTPEIRGRVNNLMIQYEQYSGIVKYNDEFLALPISTEVVFENGNIRTAQSRYVNGTRSMEYYNIGNTVMKDSSRYYYPNGALYSRSVNPQDPARQVYEKFFETGGLKSRNIPGQLFTWHTNGNLEATYIFDGDKVAERMKWHPNGKIKEISLWMNDTMNGQYREWDSTGHLLRDVVFAMGKEKTGHN